MQVISWGEAEMEGLYLQGIQLGETNGSHCYACYQKEFQTNLQFMK